MKDSNTKSRAESISIGNLSRCTGVKVETRYYERIGLLPPPPRTQGGHRLYGDHHRLVPTWRQWSRGCRLTMRHW